MRNSLNRSVDSWAHIVKYYKSDFRTQFVGSFGKLPTQALNTIDGDTNDAPHMCVRLCARDVIRNINGFPTINNLFSSRLLLLLYIYILFWISFSVLSCWAWTKNSIKRKCEQTVRVLNSSNRTQYALIFTFRLSGEAFDFNQNYFSQQYSIFTFLFIAFSFTVRSVDTRPVNRAWFHRKSLQYIFCRFCDVDWNRKLVEKWQK